MYLNWTQPVAEDSDNSSDEGSEVEHEEDGAAEESGQPSQPAKDPNGAHYSYDALSCTHFESASRQSHKEQKALLDQRKAAKPHSALLTEAKRAWSLARQKNLSKDERTKHIHALMDIIRGKVNEIVFKHDASRIVQTVVKYGGQKERNEIGSCWIMHSTLDN